MKELLQKIQMAYNNLSATQKSVASYILENYKEIPFLSVTSLAREIGVSETTIIKFCMQMGFDGYGSFKKILSEYVQSEMTSYKKLELQAEEIKNDSNTLDRVCACEAANITQTLNNPLNRANFEPFLDLIQKAETVYILGFRSSAILAEYAALYLSQQNINAIAVTPGLGAYADTLCKIKQTDLLVAINFSRYSKEVVKAVEIAAKKSVPCVLITDSPANPIYPKVDLTFSCEMKSYYYAASHVGGLALINAVCTALSLSHMEETKEYLKKLEDLFEEFNTFFV